MDVDIKAQCENLKEDFKRIAEKARTEAEKLLLRGGELIANNAKRRFRSRLEESIEGEAPRVQTGLLRASINKRGIRDGQTFYVEVGTNVPYGKELEFGTSRKRVHPFLTPAFYEELPAIKGALTGMAKELKDA